MVATEPNPRDDSESRVKAGSGSHGIDFKPPVENLFFRYKRALGNSLRSYGYDSQMREATIGCNVLNRMAEFGKPESQAIVAA